MSAKLTQVHEVYAKELDELCRAAAIITKDKNNFP